MLVRSREGKAFDLRHKIVTQQPSRKPRGGRADGDQAWRISGFARSRARIRTAIVRAR